MFSLTLIVCLLSFPAVAHETSPGPIAGAIPGEAARLVAQGADASAPDAEQRDTLTLSEPQVIPASTVRLLQTTTPNEWATVQALQPSTPITVKATSGALCEPDDPCRFASADDTTLRVADDKALRKTHDIPRIDCGRYRLRVANGREAHSSADSVR